MSNTAPKQKGIREYRRTGLFTLKRALIDLGSRAIDGRSSVGVALRRWKADLVQDLGGDDSISKQQETSSWRCGQRSCSIQLTPGF